MRAHLTSPVRWLAHAFRLHHSRGNPGGHGLRVPAKRGPILPHQVAPAREARARSLLAAPREPHYRLEGPHGLSFPAGSGYDWTQSPFLFDDPGTLCSGSHSSGARARATLGAPGPHTSRPDSVCLGAVQLARPIPNGANARIGPDSSDPRVARLGSPYLGDAQLARSAPPGPHTSRRGDSGPGAVYLAGLSSGGTPVRVCPGSHAVLGRLRTSRLRLDHRSPTLRLALLPVGTHVGADRGRF